LSTARDFPWSTMPCLLKNPLVSRFTILTLVLGALLPFTSSNPTESSVESAGIAGLSSSNVLVSRYMEDVKLRYVVDSGVCETTPGVHQMSGYIDVGENMSMVRSIHDRRVDVTM